VDLKGIGGEFYAQGGRRKGKPAAPVGVCRRERGVKIWLGEVKGEVGNDSVLVGPSEKGKKSPFASTENRLRNFSRLGGFLSKQLGGTKVQRAVTKVTIRGRKKETSKAS